jgi:hypothetical protein
MSHFSKLKVQIKDRKLAESVFKTLNWTSMQVEEYFNPWSMREVVKNALAVKKADGRVALVIAENGDVIHDPYYMGQDAFTFLKQYTEAFIRAASAREGARVNSLGVDKSGNTILEVTYVYA